MVDSCSEITANVKSNIRALPIVYGYGHVVSGTSVFVDAWHPAISALKRRVGAASILMSLVAQAYDDAEAEGSAAADRAGVDPAGGAM